MRRYDLNGLYAFIALAEEKSFGRAAAKLGISRSALSHAMQALEAQLGVRLLARTTRSVSTTEAGERLLGTLGPALEEIRVELDALDTWRDKPAGTIRISSFRYAALSLLWPAIPEFLKEYPEIQIEITVDDGFADIVASRHDAGIRWGENVDKDMIAVRVGPDVRLAAVAAPAYLRERAIPESPQDLTHHQCINYRLPTAQSIYAWPFEKDGQRFHIRGQGPLVFNDSDLILAAALAGQGIAYLYEDQVAEHVAAGRLIRLLADWCRKLPGFHLYYPSRKQTPPALAALVRFLRLRAVSG